MSVLSNSIGWIIGVAAILVAVLTYRFGNRRKRLTYFAKSEELVLARAKHFDKLSIQLSGTEIADPRLVDLIVQNVGHKDIGHADFDNGRAITFALSAKVVGLLASHEDLELERVTTDRDKGIVSIEPGKIACRETVAIRVLVDGVPTLQAPTNPLLDTTITDWSTEEKRVSRKRQLYGILAMLAFVLVAAAIASFFRLTESENTRLVEFLRLAAVGSALVAIPALTPTITGWLNKILSRKH